jgi:hypothetical protein
LVSRSSTGGILSAAQGKPPWVDERTAADSVRTARTGLSGPRSDTVIGPQTKDIQCGNFNWNKIYNLDMCQFCKKSRNRSIFVFSCPHFGVVGFCVSASGSSQPPLTFFFLMEGHAK